MKFKKSMLNVRKENGRVVEFTIDRRFWKRGINLRPSEINALRNEDETMCCLGLYSRACGLTADEITNVSMPSELHLPKQMEWLRSPVVDDRDEQDILAQSNDDRDLKDHRRQQTIRRRFARQGITVHFVN